MGRFYSGDINGKFWFGIQSSRAAERFGAYEEDSNTIHYVCDDLDRVEEGIKDCLDILGEDKERLDRFFEGRVAYTETDLLAFFEKEDTEQNRLFIKHLLSEYADYELGCKMRDAMKKMQLENGHCTIMFDAEC